MISVTEAKKLIKGHTKPLKQVCVSLENAGGLVLAEDIYAKEDVPAFRQSSMDGYAIIFDQHNHSYQLVGEMPAGARHPISINKGETIRIFTGAPLPVCADTVVMQEKAKLVSEQVTFLDHQLTVGTNVREKGSEIKAGTLALKKDTTLTAPMIGFIASLGIKEIFVYPKPSVAIIITGNELQAPGEPLQFGQVYESNSYTLATALKLEGITKVKILKVGDNLSELCRTLDLALTYDVVLLTGGISVGDYDFVLEATQCCEVQQIFHKVKQKPGKPLYFGTKDNKLVFGLPGNPASVLNCYYNYALPALQSLSKQEKSLAKLKAKLTHDYRKPTGLTHFLKGFYHDGEVSVLQAQESFRLSAFTQANCFIRLDEDDQEIKKGDTVNISKLTS